MIDAGIAADIDDHLACLENPIRMWQLAGCNTAVVDDVVIGTRLLYPFSAEGEGCCGGQDGASATEAKAGGSCNVVKTSRFRSYVIRPMTRFNVIVIGATVNCEVPGGSSLTTIGVLGQFVGSEHIIAIVDLGIAMKLVYVSIFFLLKRTDRERVRILRVRLAGACRAG